MRSAIKRTVAVIAATLFTSFALTLGAPTALADEPVLTERAASAQAPCGASGIPVPDPTWNNCSGSPEEVAVTWIGPNGQGSRTIICAQPGETWLTGAIGGAGAVTGAFLHNDVCTD